MNEWYPDYFDPNSNAQAFCADPDDGDNTPMKIIAWRNHFHDPELTREVEEAAQELDTEKRTDLYHKMQQQFRDRSPIAFMRQQNSVAVLRKNVTAFSSARSRTSPATETRERCRHQYITSPGAGRGHVSNRPQPS